jgi:hypothetical protein
MFPNKLAFISYNKSIPNLQVWIGNNSFLLVLGCGTTIISLNGQRVLVHNALHVPGFAVPLYSRRAHLKQHGCGFLGTFEAGMLVYFPWLFSWWTCCLTATSPTNLLAGLPRWTPSTMCSPPVLFLYTLQNSLLCHAWLLILRH